MTGEEPLLRRTDSSRQKVISLAALLSKVRSSDSVRPTLSSVVSYGMSRTTSSSGINNINGSSDCQSHKHSVIEILGDLPFVRSTSDSSSKPSDIRLVELRDVEFTVTIDHRDGAKYGIGSVLGDEGQTITDILPDGLFARWNLEHPDSAIQEGDIITAINGFPGCDGMQEEFAKVAIMKMTVKGRRRVGASFDTNGVDDLLSPAPSRRSESKEPSHNAAAFASHLYSAVPHSTPPWEAATRGATQPAIEVAKHERCIDNAGGTHQSGHFNNVSIGAAYGIDRIDNLAVVRKWLHKTPAARSDGLPKGPPRDPNVPEVQNAAQDSFALDQALV